MKYDSKGRRISTTNVLWDDLPRIHALRRLNPNKEGRKSQEDVHNVINRALTALEEKERLSK